jgi:hypothetical protein
MDNNLKDKTNEIKGLKDEMQHRMNEHKEEAKLRNVNHGLYQDSGIGGEKNNNNHEQKHKNKEECKKCKKF